VESLGGPDVETWHVCVLCAPVRSSLAPYIPLRLAASGWRAA